MKQASLISVTPPAFYPDVVGKKNVRISPGAAAILGVCKMAACFYKILNIQHLNRELYSCQKELQ